MRPVIYASQKFLYAHLFVENGISECHNLHWTDNANLNLIVKIN
jgi:hypothetical protein